MIYNFKLNGILKLFVEGTPSLAEPATIHAVINEVASLCHLPTNAEIDLEANPTSAGRSVLKYNKPTSYYLHLLFIIH